MQVDRPVWGQGMDGGESDMARPRVSDAVAARLLRQLATGDLKPGDWLPGERQLATTLGVSRVSVRAALQQLKTQGFLTAVQGGGTRVSSDSGGASPALAELVRTDRGGMGDLVELRALLETWAAERAARESGPQDRADLAALVEAMEAAPESARAALDVEFHLAIAKASGSLVYRHLLQLIRGTLEEMLAFHRHELFGTPSDDAAVLAQHRAILRAIDAGDGPGARAAMQAHLDWVRGHYRAAGL